MQRRCRWFCALATIVALAACVGPQVRNSPLLVSQWSFKPPAGWADAGNQAWQSADRLEFVSLHVLPARNNVYLVKMVSPRDSKIAYITLCGVRALFAQWRPWFGRTYSDEVVAQRPGSVAIATYYYPRLSSPDSNVERSLRTLCPKSV